MRKKLRAPKRSHGDYLIISCIVLLAAFGLTMLASASSNLGKARFDDTYYYLKRQLLYGLGVGALGFFLGSKIYYRRYERPALLILLAVLGLTALVFTPLGVKIHGAARWLQFGPLIFQPSEFLKLAFVIYLAAWLGRRQGQEKSFSRVFLPFLAILVAVSFILMRQPATSTTAILIVTALTVYFVSGAKLSYILGSVAAAAMIFLVIIYFTPYRLERLLNFIQPEADVQAGGFHLNQAQIAIGSGGFSGVGYGKSTTKIGFLPEPVGDSIFAVIAEEFGFVGASALIAVFLTLILKIFFLARKHPDIFGRLLLVGFGTLLALQTFVHIGAISGLIPLTGTPLPFISYGGTALAVFMTMGGIIVNISKYE